VYVERRAAEAAYTDPELGERLASTLRARGFGRVSVVDSRISAEEAVADVAARLGYGGRDYELIMQTHTVGGTELLAAYEELNASGVFDSPFSKRVGISGAGAS
jgi:hypothetical protein